MNRNIYQSRTTPPKGETVQELLQCKNVTIKRIISSDLLERSIFLQEEDEWVLLLEGEATLSLKGKEQTLKKGDYLFLPSNTPHTITHVAKGTLWLTIHIY